MTRTITRSTQSNWQIFRWPLVIGGCSIGGLLSALNGDGAYDALSWVLLGAVVCLICVAYRA